MNEKLTEQTEALFAPRDETDLTLLNPASAFICWPGGGVNVLHIHNSTTIQCTTKRHSSLAVLYMTIVVYFIWILYSTLSVHTVYREDHAYFILVSFVTDTPSQLI